MMVDVVVVVDHWFDLLLAFRRCYRWCLMVENNVLFLKQAVLVVLGDREVVMTGVVVRGEQQC